VKLFDLLEAQRRFVYLVVGVCSVAGIWGALQLPSAIYPEVTFQRISIVSEGSSLGARQMVFSVTRPIEEAVSTIPGVIRVRSSSIRGGSEVNVNFTPGTDMAVALQLVQARLNLIRSQLPADLTIQAERLTPSLFPILSYNLEGGEPATLYDIARYQIRPVVSRIPGVGRVDVQGSDVREIEVAADPARLAALGMSYDDLAAAIRQAINPSAVGRIARDYRQYLIVTDQEAHTVDDVREIVIATGLRVRDVATVAEGTEDKVRIVAGDGKPAALINVSRQIGGNTVAVADSVAKAMRALSRTLPSGVRLIPVYDQASLVRDAVRSVRDAMLIGAVLAIVVLLVFLRHARITAISAATIPLTLCMTVLAMFLLGRTVNLMSLGAMAIAIGLVIDDAVVITENIARHLRFQHDRRLAVRDAVQEMIWPVTTSTLTTVVVFLPLGLLEGVVGQFFAELSITLTIAVLISLVLALVLIPLLADELLRDEDVRAESAGYAPGLFGRMGRWIDGLSDRYERSLAVVIRHPRVVATVVVGLIVLGYLAQRSVETGFLPEMDEGAFVLDYWTPGGTALAESDRQVHLAERVLLQTPEVTATSRRLGSELGFFATQQNRGDIVVRLAARSDRDKSSFEVIDDVRQRINAVAPRLHIEFVQILSDVINDLAGAPRPVEIKLFGDRLDELESYAKSLGPELEKVDGLADLFNGVSEPNSELMMRVIGAEASRIGLTPTQVGDAVRGAMFGVDAGEIRIEERAVAVRVRAPDSVRYDPLRLKDFPVTAAASRKPTPLGALVSLRPVESRAELIRENQRQMISMTADVSGRALGSVMNDVRRVIATHPPPAGVTLELGGQYASQQSAFRALLLVLMLAALSVVAVMVLQFRSFTEPLVILLAAPASLLGAIAMLMLTGAQLNVSSFMGLILLVGLIVKNGIILLDFTRRLMQQRGMALEAALLEAGRARLRPILMTTLCTLFGLMPLALGIGAGSELQRPLALAVIGGLGLSTPLTLYVVPTLLLAWREGRRERRN